jgi:hypothetical protein
MRESSLASCVSLFSVLSVLHHFQMPHTAWEKIRDNNNKEVDWLIAGYINGSKYDIGVIKKGSGGLEAASKELESLDGEPLFGGCLLNKKQRFVKFYYCSESTSAMKKGRASMHKNGRKAQTERIS